MPIIIFSLLVILLISSCSKSTKPDEEVFIFETIQFGDYQWRVLATEEDRALIISLEVLERRSYKDEEYSAYYEYSDIRRYLNNGFYNSFSTADRERIYQVTNQNPDNPVWGTEGGNPTVDKIFLLSISEVEQYFSSNADRAAYYQGGRSMWWLRCPGDYWTKASYVHESGDINREGLYKEFPRGGVRPAMWIRI